MNQGIRCFISAAVVVTGISVSTAGGATLAEVKGNREAALKQIRETCRTEVDKLGSQLLVALERGRDAAKAAGNDQLVKTYDTEVELIKLVGEPPELESPVAAIARMQAIYKTSREECYGRMHRSVVAWRENYLAELTELEKKLISSNQTEAAAGVRDERASIEENPVVVQAIAAVEKLDSSAAEGAATTPAPPNTKPWFSLVKAKWTSLDGSKYFLGMLEEKGQVEMNGKKYQKGRDLIYTHAPGKLVYQFPSPVSEFRATGCLEERSGNGNITFIVETSDGEVYRGEPVKKGRNEEKIDIKFKPSTQLTIRVDENGGAAEDWAFLLKPEYR